MASAYAQIAYAKATIDAGEKFLNKFKATISRWLPFVMKLLILLTATKSAPSLPSL